MPTLLSGYSIPPIGFGNYNSFGTEEVLAVRNALEAGYRYIDSASCYKNETEVGTAIQASGLPRDEIFLLSKLWPTDYEDAEAALTKTMKELQTNYLDAYLLHWPGTNENRRLHAYEQLIRLREKGLFHSLGVSNFQPDQIETIKHQFGEYPEINQIECHPSFQQRSITDYCAEKSIRVIDYRPLNRGSYLEDPQIRQIAERKQKTINQVILRWHVEHGRIPIPKSAHEEHIRENIDIFDFVLSKDEIDCIDAMETGIRAGTDPFTFNG